jgi:predicted membrane protein
MKNDNIQHLNIFLSTLLFLIVIVIFYKSPLFFNTIYSSTIGRLLLVLIVVILSMNSIAIALMMIVAIIVFSQIFKPKHHPKRRPVKKSPKKYNKITLGEIYSPNNEIIQNANKSDMTKGIKIKGGKVTFDEIEIERYVYKNYKEDIPHKKSKSAKGVNVVDLSRYLYPKSSKDMPSRPPKYDIDDISPFSSFHNYKLL